ncbi:MAG: fructose-6-phosphate aldolase [Bacteroidia bacterium]|nr:fructose-6-phosphate aldolase [Bacteroidia bacterium]
MARQLFHVLKVKGKAKIPDYIQLRDASFTLIGYFRPGRFEKLTNIQLSEKAMQAIESAVAELPFGKITKIEIEE